MTTGDAPFTFDVVNGVRLNLGRRARGKLTLQIVLRSFGAHLDEQTVAQHFEIDSADGLLEVRLDQPYDWSGSDKRTAEPWFMWKGSGPLHLTEPPELF